MNFDPDETEPSAMPVGCPGTSIWTSATPVASNTETPYSSLDGGNADIVEVLSSPEQELLAKLEAENRRIVSDAKCPSLSITSSRKNSVTSQMSLTNLTSTTTEVDSQIDDGKGEEDLWNLWSRTVSNWSREWKRHNQFVRELVRQGVPQHFRGIVWHLLANANTSPELYASYIKTNSACEKVIRRDIARTYPEHDFFKEKDGPGQESLFNVMKAYSIHDREVGYCQGSGFIVGLLLMHMPEEESFAVLVEIMQRHRMRDMFKPSMAELGLCMFQLENLVLELLPDLHAHFQSQNFSTSIYASSWFLTLFTTTLSSSLACRVMDVFLSEGIEIVFKVAIALLTLGKHDLLSLDMENILKYLQKELPAKADVDQNEFMNLAYSISFNPKKMKKLEKEYTVIKSKEQNDIALLKCLRQENRILKQRVELLENESAALAERLVRGQVDRAEGEEETFALSREVQALRRAGVDAQHRLAVAQDEIRSLEMIIAENNSQRSSEEGVAAGNSKSEELACCLQRELVRARLLSAEQEATERELNARIQELENENKSLRRQRVDNNVAHLQDELIAVKLREAEAHLNLKELQQSVAEISDSWQKCVQNRGQTPSPVASQSNVVSDLMATPKRLIKAWDSPSSDNYKQDEEYVTIRIREVRALAELKELRLKVMELETQVQVSTNQLRRQDEETSRLREELDAALQREKTLLAREREFQHKYSDLESKAKYDSMQANIKRMEDSQKIAELKTEVSEYKLKNEVMATEGKLRNNVDDSEDSDRIRELQEQVAELKVEITRLEAWKARMLLQMESSNQL